MGDLDEDELEEVYRHLGEYGESAGWLADAKLSAAHGSNEQTSLLRRQRKITRRRWSFIDEVRDAALGYGIFDPERMKAFLQTADITPGEGVVKIQGKGFCDKSDALTMELDSTSMSLHRLEVQSITAREAR